MERGVVVSNGALEEFERLLRWDELCAQLRELYYKYLDLAAFRSEKCYFPGRRCRRSWDRQYDLGDLTLMWLHIANTAPLCGKLMRALAEVEYKIRKRALESLEKYGGVEKRTNPSGVQDVVHIHLKKPIYGYVVLWDGKLYVIWGEFAGLSKNGQARSAEIESKIIATVKQYKHNRTVYMDEHEVDEEYRRLWLEVPLPESVAKLMGGKNKAPVALFRNIGWLLSDDVRTAFEHSAGNFGQPALRIFDWISLAMYVARALKMGLSVPLIFKITVNSVTLKKSGINPKVKVRPIGATREIIASAYRFFGVPFGKSDTVIQWGYAVIHALKDAAFGKERGTYVVDGVGAWISYSSVLAMLIIGDGNVQPYDLSVTVKDGVTAREFARAVGGYVGRDVVRFRWQSRLLLPVPALPVFKKSVKLYRTLVEYPVGAVVKVRKSKYILTHKLSGVFVIGVRSGARLYHYLKKWRIRAEVRGSYLFITYKWLKKLQSRGTFVQFLTDLDKEFIRGVRRALPEPDIERLRTVMEEVLKKAEMRVRLKCGKEYVEVVPQNEQEIEKLRTMLEFAGIRTYLQPGRKVITIYERKSVEAIRKVVPNFFQAYFKLVKLVHLSNKRRKGALCVHNSCRFPPSLHFLRQSGADAVKSAKPIALHGGHPTLDKVEPAVKTHYDLGRRALHSFQNFDICPEQS